MIAPRAARAAWPIQEVTNNDYPDSVPKTNGTAIAWIGQPAPTGRDQLLWNDGTTTEIVEVNPPIWRANGPQITDSDIFFSGYDNVTGKNGNWQVFKFDMGSGQVAQLTSNPRYHGYMEVYRTNAAWLDCDPKASSKGDVYFYNGLSGMSSMISSAPAMSGSISMSAKYVAWDSGPSFDDREIYLHDIATGITSQLTNDEFNNSLPAVTDTHLGGLRQDDAGYHIYLHEFNSGNAIKVADAAVSPVLTDRSVVWRTISVDPVDSLEKHYYHIYDIQSGITTDLPPLVQAGGAVLSGENLATYASDGHDREVFFYNRRTNSFTQVTDNDSDDDVLDFEGGQLVWRHWPAAPPTGPGLEIHGTIFAENPDWNNDGTVDSDDLVVWEAGYGIASDASLLKAMPMQTAKLTAMTFYSGSSCLARRQYPRPFPSRTL